MLKLIVAVIAVLGFAGSVFAQTPPAAVPQDAAMTQPAPVVAAPKAEKKAKKAHKAHKAAKKAKKVAPEAAPAPVAAPAPAAK